ncbi:MAG: gamma-glutamyltransferase [Planctomycetota bacterium]
MMRVLVTAAAFLCVTTTGCARVSQQSGVVVSVSPPATQVGANVLAGGGNAVDASIATAFALAVTWPEAGNIGGGGFMLVAEPDRRPYCIDYRETAPATATTGMYTPGEDRHTPKHVGVPGTVAGLHLAHEKHGTVPWNQLVQPAVDLARDGFVVDAFLAESLNAVLRDNPPAELTRVYGKPGGEAWQDGDRLVLPELAETLQRIADNGPDGFYHGETADQLTAFMKQTDGIITRDDLASYEAVEREATQYRFRGHDVWGAPPPSSGGISVGLALEQLEGFDLKRGSPQTYHLVAEVLRRAFHYRALYLGDPDFATPPPTPALQPIDAERATPSASLTPALPLRQESPSTTHFSVIDAAGMAVANTYTLEQSWGSRQIAPGTGFVLNNEMGDFNWVPGRTTAGGAIGTPANLIAPGKRPLSSMSPTIVTRDDDIALITGSPGGRTIISTVLGIVVNYLALDLSPAESVQAGRLHHGWFPDVIRIERSLAVHAEELRAMGHVVELVDRQGSAHSIFVEDGKPVGVADARRGGLAISVLAD